MSLYVHARRILWELARRQIHQKYIFTLPIKELISKKNSVTSDPTGKVFSMSGRFRLSIREKVG